MQGNGVCEDGSGSVGGEGEIMMELDAFVLMINNDHELDHSRSRLWILTDILKIVKKSPPGKDIKIRLMVLL